MPKKIPMPTGMPTTPVRPPEDFGALDVGGNAPTVPNAWEQSQTRLAREKAATTGDYMGSMWRQDGLADGLAAHLAGSQMEPDPSYDPFTYSGLENLKAGIWPEFQNELFKATSAGNAAYIKMRLVQKQEDLTRLGDLGTAGTVGRLALNALMPDQLLLGIAGGWAARGVTAYQGARAAKLAADGSKLARLEAATGNAVVSLQNSSKAGAVAAGVGLGAAENAVYERLRQNYNFEDSTAGVIEAGLVGAVITSPFAYAGARNARKAVRTAERELETIQALRVVERGGGLTPAQGKALADMHKAHRVVSELEAGRLNPDEAERLLQNDFHGPDEPMENWLARFSDRIKRETEDYIGTHYPRRDGRATGTPPPSPAARALQDEAVDLETMTNFPAKAPGTAQPLEGQMASAFKKALKDREQARRASDLSSLDEATRAAKQAERETHWAQAESDRQVALATDQERMILARENADAMGSPDPLEVPRAVKPVSRPQGVSWDGREVSWMDQGGETLEGIVQRFDPSTQKLIIKTSDGMMAARPEHLDQHQGYAPEGFGGQSVGSAQVKGSQIESVASGRTAASNLRLDYFATLNRSPLKSVRELAYRLIKDAIQNDKFEAQAMTASEWKSLLKRTIGGTFQVEAKEAFQAAADAMKVPLWKRVEFATEFHRHVTEATYDPKILAALPKELQPHVQRASSAMKEVYSKMLSEMKDAGVKGADQIAPDEFYTNRIWHHGNIRQAAEKFGDDAIIDLVASAIKDKKGVLERMRKAPGTEEVRDTLTNTITHAGKSDAELLRLKASRFIRTVKALEFSPALREVGLAGRDMGTLRGQLKELGVDSAHIDDLVDLMFEVRPTDADAGRAANLKYRFQLDQSAQLETRNGVLRLSDLFETDARVLVDAYLNSMAGHVGLAKHGITSQADWMKVMKVIEDEGSSKLSTDGGRIAKDVTMLQDIHKNITGRPMSEATFSMTNRVASAVRGYTRSVMLPQLGIAAAFEMGKSVATFGFTTMLRQMPSLRGFLRSIRQGYIPDDGLARQIRLMTGFGNEMASNYIRASEIESGFLGQSLTKLETTSDRLSHISDRLSGNASFTSMTKQFSAMMSVQQFSDHAFGRALSAKKVERWVGQGINADDLPDVMAAFKAHTTRDANGTVEGIDYEAWLKQSQRTYDQFQTFLSRQVRDAIQDHDLGETMPFLQGPLGKLFGELKTFFLIGHAKNFLKQGVFHDATALQVWTIGFIAESLAYMTQTAINHPTELDKRLDPEQIARAAFFRMSSMGTASLLAETGYSVLTGGDSLVSPGMTTNTDTRSFTKTPSFIVMGRLGNLLPTTSGLVLGTDSTTSREARDLVGALPLARLYGLNWAFQQWASSFPTSDPEKVYAP